MTTSAVHAPRVRSAATAASITHTRVESVVDVVVLDSVFESEAESRGVRARRSEGIVLSVYVCFCVVCTRSRGEM